MTSWLVRLFCLRAASQQGLSPPPCAPPPATQASRHLSKRKKSARVGRAHIAKKKAHRLRPEKERNVFSFYLCIQDACATQLGCAVVARARALACPFIQYGVRSCSPPSAVPLIQTESITQSQNCARWPVNPSAWMPKG